MTQEEKLLLLKDLCARLTYGIVVNAQYKDGEGWKTENKFLKGIYSDGQVYLDCVYTTIDNIKPYLRPMSSMTEEEEIEYDATFATIKLADGHYDSTMTYKSFDWLNSHHFDYRGLIEKDLAIDCTKENNPYEI